LTLHKKKCISAILRELRGPGGQGSNNRTNQGKFGKGAKTFHFLVRRRIGMIPNSIRSGRTASSGRVILKRREKLRSSSQREKATHSQKSGRRWTENS